MRHRTKMILFLTCLTVLSMAIVTLASAKVPKCSKKLCQDVGCAADFYCASGATVKSCAEICGH